MRQAQSFHVPSHNQEKSLKLEEIKNKQATHNSRALLHGKKINPLALPPHAILSGMHYKQKAASRTNGFREPSQASQSTEEGKTHRGSLAKWQEETYFLTPGWQSDLEN